MAVPSPTLTKSDLRSEGLRRRRDFAGALTAEARAGLEQALADLVLPHLRDARIIAAYHPLKQEIGPGAIVARLAPRQRVVFPWFADRDAAMSWREGPATEACVWGMKQPPDSAAALVPDVVLVPCVFADRHGTRIGHGKGHYDRALAELRVTDDIRTIGLVWPVQIGETAIPRDPWDIRLDALATPGEWIACR